MAGSESTLTVVLQARDEMSSALQRPQASIGKLNDAFKDTGKAATAGFAQVGQQLKNVSAGFGALDASASRFAGRIGNLSSRLIGVAIAAQGLGGKNGTLDAAREGLTTFAGVAMALPGPLGLVTGGLMGGAVAFKRWSESQKEAAERTADLKREILEMQNALNESRGKFLAGQLLSKTPDRDEVVRQMESVRDQLAHQLGLQSQAQTTMNENAARPLSEAFLRAKDSAEAAGVEIEKLLETWGKLQGESNRLTLADKLKEIGGEADALHIKVMQGLVTPLEAAQGRLSGVTAAIDELVRAQSSFEPDDFESKLEDLVKRAEAEKKIISALREDEKRQQEAARKAEQERLRALENSWAGVGMGVQQYLDTMKTAKEFTVGYLQSMQGALSSVFENLMSGGKRAKNALQNLLRDMKSMLIKTVSDLMSQQVMKGFLGLLGMGGTASAAVPTVHGGAQSGGATAASGLTTATGLGSMTGLGGAATAAMGAVGVAGAAMLAAGLSTGNRTQGTIGGAMSGLVMGATIGSVIPGIGTAIGAVVGAIAGGLGGFFGSSAARKRRQRQQARARKQWKAAIARARVALKQDFRTRLGGGLSTEEQAADVGQLFSGDLSADEIQQFVDPNAFSKKDSKPTGGSTVNVGGITVNATVDGSYAVERLAADLSYHIQNQMGGAASGLT